MVKKNKDKTALLGKINIINIGVETFAEELQELGVPVIHLDWQPPASGDPQIAALLSKMGA